MGRTASADTAARIRSGLRGKTGRAFWRSLDELSQTSHFRAFLEAEFPSIAPAAAGLDRRAMLKVMGASLALSGLTGCWGEADDEALPYVRSPEFVVPGRPKYYATAVTMAGFAQPAIGKTHVGRPVKLEGNPDHPATKGATDPFLQAALLGLYDPDRSQSPRHLGRPAGWKAFDTAMVARARDLDARKGEGLRIVTGTVTSPTLARQLAALLRRWPGARWHVLEPVNDDLRREAMKRVFGRALERHLMLEEAAAVVSIDDDVLGPGPHQSTHARLWAERRRAFQGGDGESRLLVAEPTPSTTGAMAEDRLAVSPLRVPALVRAIAHRSGVEVDGDAELSQRERQWIDAADAVLKSYRGRVLVTVGAQHPPDVQALAILINERLGSLGSCLRLTQPLAVEPPEGHGSIDALAEAMMAGRVSTLVMLGVNPAYSTPAGLDFRETLQRVEFRLHAGLHYDETAALSHWHVPLEHELETWSDARAVDGTAGIIQPLVRPFHSVRSLHAVLDNIAGEPGVGADAVRATWREAWGGEFEARWSDALVRGFVADSAPPFVSPEIIQRTFVVKAESEVRGLSVVVRPDPTVWDGRFAGNAWLQETPKPLTKVTWGNVIIVSPLLAARRGIKTGDVLRLAAGDRAVSGPAWIMPGQETDTVTVTLGYGRRRGGRVAEGLGYDAFAILGGGELRLISDAELTAKGETQTIATTQLHQAMDGHDFVRTVDPADLAARTREAPVAGETAAPAPTFYPLRQWESPSWGMSIDLDTCIGCNACVVACVAENNVPVVGKDLVAQGREMHWLRVDHYHEGPPDNPKSYFQPVPCMHCEQAPCEMGCPVNAAVHSSDGLNLQVYNRCIGTRTCSSYCPYKVRRFNWFDYTGADGPELRAMRNPDVTVRQRGVMEKCTYCLQRISDARITAKKEGRAIADGEVVTACQQACPTEAIVFGDITDPDARVSRLKASRRDYSLLEEVNTRPRTTYLARIEKTRSDGGEGESG